MRSLAFATVMLAAMAAAPFAAAQSAADPRIQVVEYDPGQVVPIRAAMGYQLMLEFAPDERIENVSIGDSLAWQVTPNRKANILFIKPIDGAATNMTVVTDLRRYVFDLEVQPKTVRTPAPYAMRFSYAEPAVATPVATPESERAPQVVNSAYSVTGSRESTPVRVFDDGQMTYFEWPADGALPAVFAVAPDGSESMVNFVVRGPYIVVEQLAGRFSLRNGARVATVVNTAFPAEEGQGRRRRR